MLVPTLYVVSVSVAVGRIVWTGGFDLVAGGGVKGMLISVSEVPLGVNVVSGTVLTSSVEFVELGGTLVGTDSLEVMVSETGIELSAVDSAVLLAPVGSEVTPVPLGTPGDEEGGRIPVLVPGEMVGTPDDGTDDGGTSEVGIEEGSGSDVGIGRPDVGIGTDVGYGEVGIGREVGSPEMVGIGRLLNPEPVGIGMIVGRLVPVGSVMKVGNSVGRLDGRLTIGALSVGNGMVGTSEMTLDRRLDTSGIETMGLVGSRLVSPGGGVTIGVPDGAVGPGAESVIPGIEEGIRPVGSVG